MHGRNSFVWKLFAGMLLGIGCVLPGISGGVMAVSFGLYQPMLEAVLNLFRNPRKHITFLLPIGLGGVAGVMLTSGVLAQGMQAHRIWLLWLFIGFILGGLPQLWREISTDGRFKPSCLWYIAMGMLIALPLALLNSEGRALFSLSPLQALITGMLEGAGTIVPGISTSFVLIRLGWYQAYLSALSTLAPAPLALIGTGFALSALACMKAVQWLFDHAHAQAYSLVLGFVLSSVALVFPGFHSGCLLWADLAILAAGIACAGWIQRLTSFK